MSENSSNLYDREGNLNTEYLEEDAKEILEDCISWLRSIHRSMFLPIDLIFVLIQRDHSGLIKSLHIASGLESSVDLIGKIEALARRVDRENKKKPVLHITNFSLGFAGILDDAMDWAKGNNRSRISEKDIVKMTSWRTQVQDSASVKWAIKKLAQHDSANIFKANGKIRHQIFTTRIWNLFQQAMRFSAEGGMAFLGTPHVIAVLSTAKHGILWQAAEKTGNDPKRLKDGLLRIVGTRRPAQPVFGLSKRTITPRLVRMISTAEERGKGRIHEKELLYAFLEDGGSSLELLQALGLETTLRSLLGNHKIPERERKKEHSNHLALNRSIQQTPSLTPTLDLIGRDLSDAAAKGELPIILGRDCELQRILNVLMRTEQRNPLLTGQAGVGKTALAGALAMRIHSGNVPRKLANLRIIEINGASLVGGTSYRGELEARIKALILEAEKDVVLFMDEAHAVFSARSGSDRPADVPNHFKAALASGKIAIVAATTDMEYRKWIERDPALKRRFERINIPELSAEITRKILIGLSPQFEKNYEVPLSPDAIDAAISLSERFIPAEALPDKAKKLLMDATISVASSLALSRKPILSKSHHTPVKRVVRDFDVARQVALKTGIPLDRITATNIGWWVGIADKLKTHVVGQNDAIQKISIGLIEGRLNAVYKNMPQAIFIFVGPPGSGKKDLARGLAVEIFGSEKALMTIEMSDFQEVHSLSRLVGTPPGYVGYQDEDLFVSPLRRQPSRVVLLEQFQTAHPRVQERIIRVLQEGEISDTHGFTADARHAIFVLSLSLTHEKKPIGFGESKEHSSLRRLAPELFERLSDLPYHLIHFRGIEERDKAFGNLLLDKRINDLSKALFSEYGLTLKIGKTIRDQLEEELWKLTSVAQLNTLFHDVVIRPITSQLLRGVKGDIIQIGSDDPASTPKQAFLLPEHDSHIQVEHESCVHESRIPAEHEIESCLQDKSDIQDS